MMTVGTTSGVGIGTGIAKPSKTLHLTYVLVLIFCPFSLANISDLVLTTPLVPTHFLFYYNFTLTTRLLDHSKYNRILDHSMCIHLSF